MSELAQLPVWQWRDLHGKTLLIRFVESVDGDPAIVCGIDTEDKTMYVLEIIQNAN